MLQCLNSIIPNDNKYKQWPQILTIIISSIAPFINGAIVNWTSPSIPILISNTSHIDQITLEEASYFTVIPPATAAIASPILAILVDSIGRKRCILLTALCYLISWILIAAAPNHYVIYVARFFEGIGDTGIFTAVPMYVGEISEPKVRGSWGNLIAVSMFAGYFVLNIIGSYCTIRTTAIIFGSMIALQIPLIVFMPESPHFLIMKNKENEARAALQQLRWVQDVEDELMVLTKSVQKEISESGSFKDLFTVPTNFKALMISLGLRATQPLSGSSAFTAYTQYIFLQAGTNLSASTCAIIFSGMFAVCMGLVSFFVEKYGRKPLMVISSSGCTVVLTIMSIYFFLYEKTAFDLSTLKWIPLAGMLIYVPFCSGGFTLIPNLMLSELFASSVKGKALCILNVWFQLLLLVVSKLFPTFTSLYGIYVPFCFFAFCCLASGVFSFYCLPETKGKTLEQIQDDLKGLKR